MRSRLDQLARELAKFGTVGAFGFLVNVAVFNLCLHTLQLASVRSGVIATAVAIGFNYVGNRYWTYRHADKNQVRRELTLFLLFSGIGLVVENGVLALSHYGLDHTSPLADNLAKNVVGLGLATVFRFWAYRNWVFRHPEPAAAEPADATPPDPEPADATAARGRRPAGPARAAEAAATRGGSAGGGPLTTLPAQSSGHPAAPAGPAPGGAASPGVLCLAAEEEREDRRELLK